MRAFRASSSSLSPLWKSMARLTLPSRLELKSPEGSLREAPLAKVIFTTFLYVSPVQISPLCDQTGVPLHFHSSATSRSASMIRARSRESISPLQSPRSSILASISSDGDSAPFDRLFFMLPASPCVAFLPCLAMPLSLVKSIENARTLAVSTPRGGAHASDGRERSRVAWGRRLQLGPPWHHARPTCD